MINALLFDMDGTITDTEKIYTHCWVEAAHETGCSAFNMNDALELRSLNRTDAKKLLQARFGSDFSYEKVHDICTKNVDLCIKKNGLPLKPGLMDILNYLHAQNIKAAVVTATGYDRACARLASVHLLEHFDIIISAHQVAKGKPYPDPYLYACHEISESPENCIAVEDSPNGILSASRAGCQVIMVPDLSEPTPEISNLLLARADSLAAIIPVIQKMPNQPK